MSAPFPTSTLAMPAALRGALSPLLYLAGWLQGRLDEDERRRLEHVLRSCLPPLPTLPSDPLPPAPGLPISIIRIEGEEPFLLYHAGGSSPHAPHGTVHLGPARIWEPLLRAQGALVVLEQREPRRAAALWLRGLAGIWLALMDARRFDILIGAEFLALYREALTGAEALAVRRGRHAPG